MIPATGAGRVVRSGMAPESPPEVGVTPIAASPSAVTLETLLLRAAPSAETPTAPPRLRKNTTVELAEPRSAVLTVFCTASTRFCSSMPTPRPISAMYTASRRYWVS